MSCSFSARLLGAALLCALTACGSTGTSTEELVVIPDLVPMAGTTLELFGTATVQPGAYDLPPLGEAGVIRLEGLSGVELTLTGVTVRGAPASTDPDQLTGSGLVLVDCHDVVVKGGTFGGYKGCVVLEQCTDVVLEGLQFEGWYAQRLLSTVASENQADWLRPHDNDEGEWLANLGAAISASRCEGLTIRGCRGRGGQNGILLTRVDASEVYDCDFSFLSGWGLGMFRSSSNTISHNIFDYCVRGYSHGVYWRGQDSAGILMFERCSDNVVAFNSATHGGDGVFLFAGEDLVEGESLARNEASDPGGSDRNLFYGNDLRHAVANSLEATFSSDNLVIKNRLSGSHQHGVWGGYSNRMIVVDNEIHNTLGGGVTIEHGQDCLIAHNDFRRNDMGVELYWDPDPELTQVKHIGRIRDTSSRDHFILYNEFQGNDQDLVLRDSQGVTLSDNLFPDGANRLFLYEVEAKNQSDLEVETLKGWLAGREGRLPAGNLSRSTLSRWSGTAPARLSEVRNAPPPLVAGTQMVSAEARGEAKGGLETIVMGEWGPWDFRSGDPRPAQRRPGGVLSQARWSASWLRWDPSTQDPRGDLAAWRALADDAVVRRAGVENWLNPWGSEEVRRQVGNDHFGLLARTSVTLPAAAAYRLVVTSDDGIRVLIDDEIVLEDWTWHAPKTDEIRLQLEAGDHEIRLEYFQIDGANALSLELLEVK